MTRRAGKAKNLALAAIIMGPLFIVIGGIVAFYVGKPIINDCKRCEEWPSVTGVIDRSEVAQEHDSDGGLLYSPSVGYHYQVEDQEHTSDRISFSGNWSSSSRSASEKVIAKYPVGDSVEVYYNPEQPNECTLETGTTWGSYTVFFFGLLFMGAGSLVFMIPFFGFILVLLAAITEKKHQPLESHPSLQQGMGGTPTSDTMSRQTSPSSRPRSSPIDDQDDGIEI